MAKMINILGKHRRCHIFLMALALFVALAAGCSNHSSNPPTQTTLPLVIISDVHFTPFYDTAIFNDLVHFPVEQWASIFQSSGITDLSSWGHETNYLLLIKVLDAAQKAAGDGHVLLFSGDILAHKFPETFFALYGKEDEEALHAFIYKTVVFFATQVRERSGSIPVVFALGNTDAYAGDYKLVPGGAFLADTADTFYNTFLLGGANHEEYFNTYPTGGYFVAEPPGAKVQFICLSTVFFSRNRTDNNTGEADNIAIEQLAWLERVLGEADTKKKKVWLVMHIPPGADIFGTVETFMDPSGHISDAAGFWKEAYQERFLEISSRYAHIIEAIFAGHTHMDKYRLLLDNDGEAYQTAIITPAVSPQYGNNPAFKVVVMREQNWELLDYRSVNCDLESAAPDFSTYYVFSNAYFTEMPLQASLVTLFPKLAKDTACQQAYARFYYSGHNAADIIDDINWPAYWCGIGKMDRTEYIECVNTY